MLMSFVSTSRLSFSKQWRRQHIDIRNRTSHETATDYLSYWWYRSQACVAGVPPADAFVCREAARRVRPLRCRRWQEPLQIDVRRATPTTVRTPCHVTARRAHSCPSINQSIDQSINHNFKWTNAKALQSLYINMGDITCREMTVKKGKF